MKDQTIAAACISSLLGKYEDNFGVLERMARLAKEGGADVVLFPEACMTGYGVGEYVSNHAIGLNHAIVEKVCDLAAELNMALVVGLMEKTSGDGLAYLTQLMVDRWGELAGVYRKTHLGPTEHDRFKAGSTVSPVWLDDSCYGLQLCYDGHYPDLSTIQAENGAEILLVGHASPRIESPQEKLNRWLRYLTARAYDNTTYLAACNLVGDNGQGLVFPGVAVIIGPKGEVLDVYTGEKQGLAMARIDKETLERIKSSRMGFFRGSRRDDIY